MPRLAFAALPLLMPFIANAATLSYVDWWHSGYDSENSYRQFIGVYQTREEARKACDNIARSSRVPVLALWYSPTYCQSIVNTGSPLVSAMYMYCNTFFTAGYPVCRQIPGLFPYGYYTVGSFEFALCPLGSGPELEKLPSPMTFANGSLPQRLIKPGCFRRVPVPKFKSRNTCETVGNPIVPSTGAKRQKLSTGVSIGSFEIEFYYDSSDKLPGAPPIPLSALLAGNRLPFGGLWTASSHPSLHISPGSDSLSTNVLLIRGDGTETLFSGTTGVSWLAAVTDSDDKMFISGTSTGQKTYYHYDFQRNRVSIFDGSGQLLTLSTAGGERFEFIYANALTASPITPEGYLSEIRDQFGRKLGFRYADASAALGKLTLSRLVDTNGREIAIGYDANQNLNSITFQDQRRKNFLYENVQFQWALTGLVDENSIQTAFYGYDNAGRATSTALAGNVDAYSVTYGSPPVLTTQVSAISPSARQYSTSWTAPTGVVVTSPNMSPSTLDVVLVNGSLRVKSRSQPAGAGCDQSTSEMGYDDRGNVTQSDDFNGNRTCTAFESARNFPTTVIQGLSKTAQCDALVGGNVQLPTGSRKITTEWHPDWRLPTRRAEPGRITTNVYNGQPDRLTGGVARCAPATALLPDGKPIAVLCKQVEQATDDANGHQGFAATLQPDVAARVRNWEYNEFGQVLTAKGPRTDLDDTVRFDYYDNTTTEYTKGDLKRMTPPLLPSTLYTKYSPAGQLLESRDPNDVVTNYEYDARQRLKSFTVAGQTMLIEYWPTGLTQRITLPDGTWTYYVYDDAHRLKIVSDNLGNSVTYTLDNFGNRTAEEFKDPSGTLRRSLGRGIDALGRVQQVTGRE